MRKTLLSGFWKADRLIPVVTLVIYFGSDSWDAPLSLKEMYSNVDDAILTALADTIKRIAEKFHLSESESREAVLVERQGACLGPRQSRKPDPVPAEFSRRGVIV